MVLIRIFKTLFANKGKRIPMVFSYQMDTERVLAIDSWLLVLSMGLEAYDGEINLGVEENMIPNEYAVKLCLEHEVKRGNKVVKKELIVALRGEIYFVKFIINLEEDNVEPGVILSRSFLRLTKAITDFGARTVTIYPDIDPFLEETEEEGKNKDDWDHLLDFNIDDIPLLGEEGLPTFETSDQLEVGVTTLIAKFLILDIPIDLDSPIVVGHGFLRTIGAIVNTPETFLNL
ncbi:hypothetical protein Tco_0490676 [Tanacetum coccineum]